MGAPDPAKPWQVLLGLTQQTVEEFTVPGIRLPFFARPGQIPLSIITFFGCGLSFWLTVRFCGNLAPRHAPFELFAIGIPWEAAKLTFGTEGLRRIKRGDASGRASGYGLMGVSLILAMGSIAASLAFLTQTDQRLSQEALHASLQALQKSAAYERESTSLENTALDMNSLRHLALKYESSNQIQRSDAVRLRVAALQATYDKKSAALAGREMAVNHGDIAASGALLLGCSPTWRLTAQVVLAVMLEVISMISLGLLLGSRARTSKSGSVSSGGSACNVVRLKVAAPRIISDAGPHRPASSSPPDADACAQQTLLHRIDTAPYRITSDAAAHRAASTNIHGGARVERRTVSLYGTKVDDASMRIASDAATHRAAPLQIGNRDAQRLRALYAQAKELVRTARLRPCYREMQRSLGASQQVVQRFLRELVAEGILCRRGTGYVLASPLDVNGGAA